MGRQHHGDENINYQTEVRTEEVDKGGKRSAVRRAPWGPN